MKIYISRCTIQNSVLCENVIIENNCNINECALGANYRVSATSKLKNEQLK
jgi:ADP-glucose pyrophosphorylase